MQAEHDAMTVVRSELCERLENLQRLSRHQAGRDFTESVLSIRRLAAAYGLTPVVHLADTMERAIAESSRHGGPTGLYLDRLRDAIGCETRGDQASQAIASMSVRLDV